MAGDEFPWFGLQVKALHEIRVGALLRLKGYEEFVPVRHLRRRWSDRNQTIERPLFPGYVFSRFNPRFRMPILTTPGVFSIVGVGKEPAAVSEGEIDALKTLMRSGLDAVPWPYIDAGCRVRIEDGPLCGVEGVLLRTKPPHRLVLSVSLLRRSVAVEIDANWVTPLGPAGGRPLGEGAAPRCAEHDLAKAAIEFRTRASIPERRSESKNR